MIDTLRSTGGPRPAAPDRLLSISRFSRRSLLSPKALRLYDRLGLLRRLDMPLARIGEVMAAGEVDRAGLLGAWWADAEDRFARQRELTVWLRNRLTSNERQVDMFEIEDATSRSSSS